MTRAASAKSAADIQVRPWWSDCWVIPVLAVALGLHCIGLHHASVKPLDEVFHAIVARNLIAHPFEPVLNRFEFVQTSSADWQNAHIWLHKPPLALWQIACSFAALGVSTFTLRLPSALLSTAAAGLTYLIGRRLFDPAVAWIALLLQLFNPVLAMLVQGYVFSDHVDISLLFWSELSVYFLLRLAASGQRIDALICGGAQGAAFLSKTFPALITVLLALLLLALTRQDDRWRRLRVANVGWLIFGTLLVAGPWNVYAYLNWPDQYLAQTLGILAHLNHDVEGWAAPWDRLMVDYGWRVFHVFYPALIVASLLAIQQIVRRRANPLTFVLAWLTLVLLPNLLATSKPMTATLVGWPAAWLLLAWLIVQAFRGDARVLAGLLLSTLGYLALEHQAMPTEGWGFVPGHLYAGVLSANWQPVAIGIGAAAVSLLVAPRQIAPRFSGALAATLALLLFACPLGWGQPHSYLRDFWRVGQIQRPDPIEPKLARLVRSLPPQAVILIQTQTNLEDKLLQWETDRDCWPMPKDDWQQWADQITRRGGLPYVVTGESLSLAIIEDDLPSGRHVYATSALAEAAAKQLLPH